MTIFAVIFVNAIAMATPKAALEISSPAFKNGGEIPTEFTCEGKDLPPPLEWKNVPKGTKGLVLIVDDPDAPDPAAPKMTWVHWVLMNLPPVDFKLAAGFEHPPKGSMSGMNSWSRKKFGGPCPPIGKHRYFFKLYALDRILNSFVSPDKAQLEKMMSGHILGQATLIGTYEKKKK